MPTEEVRTKKLTRKQRSIASKYRKLVKAHERAAAQYALADRLAFEIAQLLGGHGKTCRITADGKGIQVIEPLKAAIENPKRAPDEMPKGWCHAAFRQFEIKETSLVE